MSALEGVLPLDAVELYGGQWPGPRRTKPADLPDLGVSEPRAVLEAIVRDALKTTPCHVSFSGGRDSSIVLALATRLARQEGLPLPIPLTARYPLVPAADEGQWQELVVEHLGLEQWRVFEITTEMDVLGPAARQALERHGVSGLAPAHSMSLMARQAGGGTLLTGTGGDELFTDFAYRRFPFGRLIRLKPRRRAVIWTALNVLPTRSRRRVLALRARRSDPAWLTPAARRALNARRRTEPVSASWVEDLLLIEHSRAYELVRATLTQYAEDEGTRLVEPLFDPRYIRALAAHGPRLGYANRTAALEALFGDLLPASVLRRGDKAFFNDALMGPEGRAFAAAWRGDGVATELVEPAVLREEWAQPHPDVRALTILQQAWLATR